MADAQGASHEAKHEEKHDDKKKLEDKLKEEAKKQKAAQKKPNAIADQTSHRRGLEQKISSRKNTVFEDFGKGFVDGFKGFMKPVYTTSWMGGGGLLSYSLAGIGPFLMAAGMGLGRYFINKKIKKPFTFEDFKKEYAKGLLGGTLYYPVAQGISAAATIPEKLFRFFAFGAPTFIASDTFSEHYLDKYKGPTELYKDIKKRDIGRVTADGLANMISETPKTLAKWATSPPLLMPAIAATNWSANYALPIKYGVSVGTVTGYRYFTSKDVENHNNNDNQKAAMQQPQPTPEQLKAYQQLLQQNPQLAQMYSQQAQAQAAKAAAGRG